MEIEDVESEIGNIDKQITALVFKKEQLLKLKLNLLKKEPLKIQNKGLKITNR
jgi:hypothetical protein